jgi:hypothetical protein
MKQLADTRELSLDAEHLARSRKNHEMPYRAERQVLNPNVVDELMVGAIDIHVHAGPDVSTRMVDEADVAVLACAAKMRAIVFKQTSAPSASRAPLVQKFVRQWADEHHMQPPDIFGGVALNYAVGGLNPHAVEACWRYGGKFVWLPVTDASHHRKVVGAGGGIDVLDERGAIVPQLRDVLKSVAEHDLVLVLAHQSTRERWAILHEAKAVGVRRVVADHPQWPVTKMSIEQMREFADAGAYLSLYWVAAVANFHNPWVDPLEVVEIIQTVSIDSLVGGTDLTQPGNPDPVAGLRQFMEMLLAMGVSTEAVRTIFARNPAKLIYG